MGKQLRTGRKRVPVEKKVLEGRFRQDRHGFPPKVVGGFPEPPEHLSESERKLWETFPRPVWIGETDVLAVTGAVGIYDRILANQRKQAAAEEAGGSTLALVTQETQLWGRLMGFLASLGLTPGDRGKMTAPEHDAEADNQWAGIL
jgi:hypothetical protein